MYVHLAAKNGHAEKCTNQGCVASCDWRRFHAWLDEPLLKVDKLEDARLRQRREAFMRGDIPA